MSYIPRRRLILASARSTGRQAQWPASQVPWDDEEAARTDDNADVRWESQAACHTQEPAVQMADLASQELQLNRQAGCSDYRPAQEGQARMIMSNASELAAQAAHERTLNIGLALALTQAAAVEQFSMPTPEYTEIYNFLTKGTGHVQELSARERALFKLTDLRQVSAANAIRLKCGWAPQTHWPAAADEVAWIDSR